MRSTICPHKQVTIEIIIAADASASFGADAARTRTVDAWLNANSLYLSMPTPSGTNLRLLRIRQFVGSDPFTSSTVASDFLMSVISWRQANISTPGLGAVVAITTRDFDFSTVEIGIQSSMCTANGVSVIQDFPTGPCNNVSYAGMILAHGLGHLFSMTHDGPGNGCSSSGFVMATVFSCTSFGTAWSNCSQVFMNAFLASGQASCVATNPMLPKGDLNCDCNITAADVGPFALGLVDPAAYALQHPGCSFATQGDMNSDAAVNGADISLFVTAVLFY